MYRLGGSLCCALLLTLFAQKQVFSELKIASQFFPTALSSSGVKMLPHFPRLA